MNRFADHLMVAPIVLPLLAGATMLVLGGERRRSVNAALNVVASLCLLGVSVALIRNVDASPAGVTGVYRLGDWPAPFAIVLVVDRLAALMVLLTSVLATTAVVFSLARWHRVGVLFHPLFQFLLMGVNGAFLTGDLFNLFVFVEILLAASYGLALHGSGAARVTAGMQYIGRSWLDHPCGFAAVSDRGKSDLRRCRNPQHGRSRRPSSGDPGRGPRVP